MRELPRHPLDKPLRHDADDIMQGWSRPALGAPGTLAHDRGILRKAADEAATSRAMHRLLKRRRLAFPDVPVLLDGERVPGAMLDDCVPLLHLAADPLETLVRLLSAGGAVESAWRLDPERSGLWSALSPGRTANLRADIEEDLDVLKLDWRTLAAPLLLVTEATRAAQADAAEALKAAAERVAADDAEEARLKAEKIAAHEARLAEMRRAEAVLFGAQAASAAAQVAHRAEAEDRAREAVAGRAP